MNFWIFLIHVILFFWKISFSQLFSPKKALLIFFQNWQNWVSLIFGHFTNLNTFFKLRLSADKGTLICRGRCAKNRRLVLLLITPRLIKFGSFQFENFSIFWKQRQLYCVLVCAVGVFAFRTVQNLIKRCVLITFKCNN